MSDDEDDAVTATATLSEKEQLVLNNKYVLEAWLALLSQQQQQAAPKALSATYDRFLEVFPTSARHWSLLADLELRNNGYEAAKAVYERGVKGCPNVELWRSYLDLLRKHNGNASSGSIANSDIVKKAYEQALDSVGLDLLAGPIWKDYIAYIGNLPTKDTFEEQVKMDTLRKAYHRAVAIPMLDIEEIWRNYSAFENTMTKAIGQKQIRDHSPIYMSARPASKERNRLHDAIDKTVIAKPQHGSEKELLQLSKWMALINWEKATMNQLENYHQRVIYSYRQCLCYLRFSPEVWFSFAQYLIDINRKEEAIAVYNEGTQILADSLVLNLAYAEFLESQQNIDGAVVVYERLVKTLESKLDALVEAEKREKTEKQRTAIGKAADGLTLAFINYMRFARRAQSQQKAREIFKRARTNAHCRYHIFIASGQMEFHMNKEPQIAAKVYEHCMNNVAGSNANFALEYLDFLSHRNEDNNTRAVFECVVSQVPKESAKEVWNRFLDFEINFGDLDSLKRVDGRIRELYETGDEIGKMKALIDRYRYKDLLPCSTQAAEFYEIRATGTLSTSYGAGSNIGNMGSTVATAAAGIASSLPTSLTLTLPQAKDTATLAPMMIGGSSFIFRKGTITPTPLRAALARPELDKFKPSTLVAPPPYANANLDPIGYLLNTMPPAQAYSGPMYDVDAVLRLVAQTHFPPPPLPPANIVATPTVTMHRTLLAGAGARAAVRRTRNDDEDDDTSNDASSSSAGDGNAFRSRRLKLEQQ